MIRATGPIGPHYASAGMVGITGIAASGGCAAPPSEPLTAADLDLAARYLRFDYGATGELDPKSPWSRLATHYVRLYEAGSDSDYERLATILNELDKPS